MNSDKNLKINSINYMKLICAFLVIAIHTHPFEDINKVFVSIHCARCNIAIAPIGINLIFFNKKL